MTKSDIKEINKFIKQIRTAIADYMYSEGCSCCENTDKHKKAEIILAKLLKIPKYKDNSGFNFYKFKTK